ncbi:MAG: hypothetical protein QXY49_07295 [Thermofilaceae archaeon]
MLKTLLSEVDGLYVDIRGVVRRVNLEARVADALSVPLGKLRRFLDGVRG